jgi:hydrogenase nickel incorporation protein HypA/HybF
VHELSIASAILEAVEAEASRHPGARFTKVAVRVGELSGVNSDALAFGFEALVKDSPWEPLALEIEDVPLKHHCPQCDATFPVQQFETQCPGCGNIQTKCVSGEELDIAYMELEEP